MVYVSSYQILNYLFKIMYVTYIGYNKNSLKLIFLI